VLIFGDQTPPRTLRRRSCRRAQRVGALCASVATAAATVRNQVGIRLGHLSWRSGSVQTNAPPPWTTA